MKAPYTKSFLASSLALTLLLSSGTLTGTKLVALAEAADLPPAVNGTLKQKQEIGAGVERRMKLPIYEEAAELLGMDKEALRTLLKERSLVQIAADKGISEAELLAKLHAQRSKKIDAAVAAGKLSAEKAQKVKEHMQKHLTFMVNQQGLPDRRGISPHGRSDLAGLPVPDKLAGILGITEQQLKSELRSGKSLAEIAQGQGMTKEQLVAKMKEEITPWINKMVDRKQVQMGGK